MGHVIKFRHNHWSIKRASQNLQFGQRASLCTRAIHRKESKKKKKFQSLLLNHLNFIQFFDRELSGPTNDFSSRRCIPFCHLVLLSFIRWVNRKFIIPVVDLLYRSISNVWLVLRILLNSRKDRFYQTILNFRLSSNLSKMLLNMNM